jgi:Mrp family chromosome partitioning ATPase
LGSLAINTGPSGGAANPFSRLTPAELTAQIDRVKELYNQAQKELMTLGTQRLHMQSLQQDETEAKAKLDAVQNQIDEINVESEMTGRIEIDPASQPVAYKKTRPIEFGGLGVFGGMGLGFGFVMLIGLIDRRLRSPADAKLQNSPMLGVLPNLPDDLSDPEQAAVAAHYVHQIRTLLQIWDSSRGKQVFSITSPVSGTGKTSLVLALGVSFAAASKTLLIDCDLVSGGLTHRANAIAKRKIGRILQKEGLLTDRQLEEALRLANGSRRRLGEILVELGYLKESDLTQALVTQQKADVGLIDAINGDNLDDCVAETGIANLSVLALGGATAQQISRITPQAIRKLLQQCRERFDTVLIDSGPIPGSLEASAVAAEVDGVILCVSRGEQRPLAERCIQHLYSLGARVAGVVFNRARTEDMMLDSATIRSSQPIRSDAGTLQQSSRFGPMARAVASAAAQNEEGNGKNGK